jgi:hypothetical protein
MLTNEEFGDTKIERYQNQKKATRVAWVTGTLAVIATIWTVFNPTPYDLAFFTLFLFPPAGLLIAARYKGLIRFSSPKNSPYPTIMVMVLAPIIGAAIRILTDYQLYTYGKIWACIACGALLFTIIAYVICGKVLALEESNFLTACVTVLVSGAYTFGIVFFFNCYYDHSKAQEFRVSVVSKHINSGKSKSYHLVLEPWGRFTDEDDESVGHTLYNDAEPGQKVHIYLFEGKWNIPWYYVSE